MHKIVEPAIPYGGTPVVLISTLKEAAVKDIGPLRGLG